MLRDLGGKAWIGIAGENHEVRRLNLHERVQQWEMALSGAASDLVVCAAGQLQRLWSRGRRAA
ncbi:MAG: hypothetical protein WA159_17055 [Variovorax sp.]